MLSFRFSFDAVSFSLFNRFLLHLVEDLERNDGSEEKPYYMSKGLMELLGKQNKKPKKET